MDNGDFFGVVRRKTTAPTGARASRAVKRKQRLRFLLADAHQQAFPYGFDSRMSELRQGIEDPLADLVLAWIEKQEFLQFLTALWWCAGGKDDVHADFFDCTRFHNSSGELIEPRSAACKFTL